MKIKQITFILTGILLMSVFSYAQQTASRSSVSNSKTVIAEWIPVTFSQTEKSLNTGVEFYTTTNLCGNDTMLLIRIVNSNTYPVNIQWQDASQKTISFDVPASSVVEGVCNAAANTAESYLVFQKSMLKKDNNKLGNSLQSTLKISKVK